MISSATAFILGIAYFHFLPFFPFTINSLIIITGCCLYLRCNNKKAILLAALFFLSGIFYSLLRYDPIPEIKFSQDNVSVSGTIVDLPEVSDNNLRITLDDVSINGKTIMGKVRLYIIKAIINKAPSPLPSPSRGEGALYLFTGDVVKAFTKPKEPPVFHNPGVYSYNSRKDGILGTGYTKEIKLVRRGKGFLSWIGRMRQRLGGIINASLSHDNASFNNAIITGLKRGMGQDVLDHFSSTGLTHLLSISGTHFGLLAFLIFQFVKRSAGFLPDKAFKAMTIYITPTQAAVIVTMPLLVFYMLLAGAGAPAVRSFIMAFIYMLALLIGRRGQWLNSLSIAAFIILLWQPDELFGLSFQLSFIAVLSLGLIMENNEETEQATDSQKTEKKERVFLYVDKFAKSLKSSILITIAAVMGTAPLIALYFKQFPLVSPLTNLIITPIVCFIILPLGFLTGFASLLFDLQTLPLSWLLNTATGFTLYLTEIFSNIPYANIHVPNPSFLMIMFYYLSCVFLLKSSVRWRYFPLVIVVTFYLLNPLLSEARFRITFLDVGQGDSSLIELPDGKVMLIDGGPTAPDSGRMVVAPYLWSKGIRKIDYLVISHTHPDHYGGISCLLNNFDAGEVWTSGRGSDVITGLIDNAKDKKIIVKTLKRGQLLEGKGYKIYVLHPYAGFYTGSPRGQFSDENSGSLVLKIESDSGAVLFTGDIEEEAENNIAHLGAWLKSDIIKVPHHGGRTSSSIGLLNAVKPELAVASVGRNNSFHHPHEETVRRYIESGTRLLRTDRDGAVIVTFNEEGYEATTYSDSEFKEAGSWEDEVRNLMLLL
ncbi:MAG: DNA internalization-related competence protein ComEC/Rec2 [Nitrospirae bacterium]|nr:DNA internalization-related competence protein ComEC/Rec2 [Nitrospirota bacterium]